MQFPLYYAGELVFYKPEAFDYEQFLLNIGKDYASVDNSDKGISFNSKHSFLKLPLKVYLSVIDDNTSIHCKYKISLFENNIALLLSWVFASFFYYNHNIFLVWVFLCLGPMYYLLNTSHTSNGIKKLIYKQIGAENELDTMVLWKMQKEWMKDKTLCPACGEKRNPYSNKCVNCGIYFSQKEFSIDKVNLSGPNSIDLNYEYKKKPK